MFVANSWFLLEILVSSPVEGQQLQQKKKTEKPKDIKQLSLEILISAHTWAEMS